MKERRAISEIMSVMVILMIISIAGVLLYNISIQTTLAQQSSLQDEVDKSIGAAVERFQIIGVQRISEDTMEITIFNFAKHNTIDITISEIYVNNIRVDNKFGNLTIKAGEISSI